MSKTYQKILIIRQSSIGDIILTTPLVRAVRKRFPKAQIDFLVKKEFATLLQHNPHISNVLAYDKTTGFEGLKALKKQFRATKYDRIIDLHKNLRSTFLKIGLNALTTSYSKEYINRFLLLKLRINRYKNIIPVYEQYFDAVRKDDIFYDGKGTEVFLPDAEIQKVRQSLKAENYDFQKPLVVLCPGASSPTKRWTPEGFAEVGNFYAQNYGAWIVFSGGKEDVELCQNIAQNIDYQIINFAGKFNLLGSGALLGQANLVVTNDTGMMHMAQAQKTPVTAIFGCTVKELGFFPLPKKSNVVEYQISCRPCTHNGRETCPKGHFDCMKKIKSQAVIEAGKSFLEN